MFVQGFDEWRYRSLMDVFEKCQRSLEIKTKDYANLLEKVYDALK